MTSKGSTLTQRVEYWKLYKRKAEEILEGGKESGGHKLAEIVEMGCKKNIVHADKRIADLEALLKREPSGDRKAIKPDDLAVAAVTDRAEVAIVRKGQDADTMSNTTDVKKGARKRP